MKYSIIIPTLNEEKLLPGLLDQLTDEKFRTSFDTEIIISDGGSRDRTIELAMKYSDIVKVHILPERQNIAEGRNAGARFASGDILVFINADILLPDPVEFFDYLETSFANSSLPALACRVKVFPEEEILSDKLFHSFYNFYFKILNLTGVGMGRGECQVVRKNIFESVGGYNEAMAAGEDFDLFRRIRRFGKIVYSMKMCVYESPRRFRKLGYTKVSLSWAKNGLSVLFRNKSLSKEWEQVR